MSPPPIFRQLTFEQARAEAGTKGRLLVVDFSTEWCQPCKNMDRTTWREPAVVAWLEAEAIAIQLDGDVSPLTESLNVRAYPTIIVFSGEAEVDRISGARPAAALLEWFGNLKSGRTELDRLRATPREDLHGQLSLASELVEKGLDDEALEVFAWLWEHCLEIEPAWVGVRSSFLLGALEPLLVRSPAARGRFAGFRDAAAQRADVESFGDFVTLNATLGEEERTLDWLRAASPADAAGVQFDRNHRLIDLVRERGEWALLGRLLQDPKPVLERFQQLIDQIRAEPPPPDFPKELQANTLAHFEAGRRQLAEVLVCALRAVNREEEAVAVEALARKYDGPSTAS